LGIGIEIRIGLFAPGCLSKGQLSGRLCYNLNKIAAPWAKTKGKADITWGFRVWVFGFLVFFWGEVQVPFWHRKQKHRYNHKTINRSWPFHLITGLPVVQLICIHGGHSFHGDKCRKFGTPLTFPSHRPLSSNFLAFRAF